jgi:hypothetical protein
MGSFYAQLGERLMTTFTVEAKQSCGGLELKITCDNQRVDVAAACGGLASLCGRTTPLLRAILNTANTKA